MFLYKESGKVTIKVVAQITNSRRPIIVSAKCAEKKTNASSLITMYGTHHVTTVPTVIAS